jgi:FkbM family methyltransferase
MVFSTSLQDLCQGKQSEISRRGLMGFPIDSDHDSHLQKLLAQEISEIEGTAVYQSPTTGLLLHVDKCFPAQMLYYFLVGDYEEHDMQLIAKYVTPGSRVLELGGGAGLTGSLMGKMSGNPVSICEPNPALHALIERTFAANEVELNLIKAAAVSDGFMAKEVAFNVARDYWWSSLVSVDHAEQIHVPARRLGPLIADTKADTLLVDIEGYEVELFDRTEELTWINTVLVEIHSPSIGTEASAALISKLVKAGFDLADFGGHTFVFKRAKRGGDESRLHGRWYP